MSCVDGNRTHLVLFDNAFINQWEKAISESINHIYNENRDSKMDTFQLMLLKNYNKKMYNHQARSCFIEDLRRDSAFLNAQINNCIVIEQSNEESDMYFQIICRSNSKNVCLSYKLSYKIDAKYKNFNLYRRDTINDINLRKFIKEVKISNLFKNENHSGEYYNGNVVVSFLSMNKIEVFPYLTFSFSNDVYRSYCNLFKKAG